MINDKEIKSWISGFQQNDAHYEQIKAVLSEYIYHFPAIGFKVYDEDIKGDFYLFIMDLLPGILKNYQVQEQALFKTYLYLVLKRKYLNFIRSGRRIIKTVPLDENLENCQANLTEDGVDLDKISLIFVALPPKYRLILKLRCPDFLLPEDLLLIGKEFKKDPIELLKKLPLIYQDIAEKEQKRQNYLKGMKKPTKADYKRYMPLVSPAVIACFLDINSNEVSKSLTKIKEIANKKIEVSHVS